MENQSIELRVWSRRAIALDVVSIELRDPKGVPLPAFTPGAHLEITIPSVDGSKPLVRHYSLCNDPSERHRYVIAVFRNEAGRGGSIAVDELLHKGVSVLSKAPRNHFGFSSDGTAYRLIAGGIGITPLLSMLRWCERAGKPWSLLYCTRGKHRTAFYEELKGYGDRVQFHFSDEHGGFANLSDAMRDPKLGEHVYCCGPVGLMQTVQTHGALWPSDTVHFEWFSAPVAEATESAHAFEVILRKSGKRLSVPPNQSILDSLEKCGIEVPFSCREGLCRTCETSLCSGEAEHLDYVLSDEERQAQRSILICVSRARSPVLELDL